MTVTIWENTAIPNGVDLVFRALVEITRCDPGLTSKKLTGLIDGAYGTFYEIQYTPGASYAGTESSKRMNRLVNDRSFQANIQPKLPTEYIRVPDAKDPKYLVGIPMGSVAGVTDTVLTSGESSVYIDPTDAGGEHYLLPDPTGKFTVHVPLVCILYHELGHVYHRRVLNDAPSDYAANEILVRADDNAFRGELGLEPEHPSDYKSLGRGMPTKGGLYTPRCGNPKKDTYGNPWANCKACSIATAALESPVNREIAALRAAKRDYQSVTLGGAPILAPMLGSYRLFGPAVAAAVREDPGLRRATREYGVGAALRLLGCAQGYLDGRQDVIDAELTAFVAGTATVTGVGIPRAAAAALAAARAVLSDCRIDVEPWDVYGHVAAAVRARGADPAGPAWVLTGIAMFLAAAAAGPGTAPRLAEQIARWLTEVPLPETEPTERLASELQLLGDRIFPDHRQRESFAERLIRHWPAHRADVGAALIEAGFVGADREVR